MCALIIFFSTGDDDIHHIILPNAPSNPSPSIVQDVHSMLSPVEVAIIEPTSVLGSPGKKLTDESTVCIIPNAPPPSSPTEKSPSKNMTPDSSVEKPPPPLPLTKGKGKQRVLGKNAQKPGVCGSPLFKATAVPITSREDRRVIAPPPIKPIPLREDQRAPPPPPSSAAAAAVTTTDRSRRKLTKPKKNNMAKLFLHLEEALQATTSHMAQAIHAATTSINAAMLQFRKVVQDYDDGSDDDDEPIRKRPRREEDDTR